MFSSENVFRGKYFLLKHFMMSGTHKIFRTCQIPKFFFLEIIFKENVFCQEYFLTSPW
jgi:hypothetical protein